MNVQMYLLFCCLCALNLLCTSQYTSNVIFEYERQIRYREVPSTKIFILMMSIFETDALLYASLLHEQHAWEVQG